MFCEKGRPATLFKKENLAQVFSCEFCEISKNTFSYRTPLVALSVSFFFCFVLPKVYSSKKSQTQPFTQNNF